MRIISAADVDRILTYPALIESLRRAFAEGVVAPTRHHHTIRRPEGADGTLLLMPAWNDPASSDVGIGYLGVKIVTVNPDNNARGLPAVAGVYLLTDAETGTPLALIDGPALTAWRTACASALAASWLARADAERMVMVGAGRLAPHLVRAHASVRPIRHVDVWNRTPAHAEAVAQDLAASGFGVAVVTDLEAAVRQGDLISTATIAREPLVSGDWLKPGAHLDLVGGFTPAMRETDDAAVRRASLFVDTYDGALSEAGDLVQPIEAGVIARGDVRADLADLARGKHPGRSRDDEITLFKSTGAALEDLAAGILVYETASAG